MEEAVFEMTKPGSNCWYECVEPQKVTVEVGCLCRNARRQLVKVWLEYEAKGISVEVLAINNLPYHEYVVKVFASKCHSSRQSSETPSSRS